MSVSQDLALTSAASFSNATFLNEPGHIISVTAALVAVNINQTDGQEHKAVIAASSASSADYTAQHVASFSLYTLPGWTSANAGTGGWGAATGYDDGRNYLMTEQSL